MDFSPYAAVLLDLDGTLYHDDHALPGAKEIVDHLRQNDHLFACLSNGTGSPPQLCQRLGRMGIHISPDRIYTAAVAAADYVCKKYSSPRIFNLATDGITDLLKGKVTWVDGADQPCDAVIVGPPAGRYAASPDRQRIAVELIRSGSELVAICADRLYPSPRGIEFGAGALAAMLAYAAKVNPIYCGKPQPLFFNELCTRLQVKSDQCLLIGDNLESDIAGGNAIGMSTILVLTGVARRQDLLYLPADQQPGRVIGNLLQL